METVLHQRRPKKRAIRYLRWSTLEQGNSDRSSEFRQDGSTQHMCATRGWDAVDRVVDSGKSAYTGDNLTTGELGKLAHKFRTGAIDPAEHVLVVEALDRLSRQPPAKMIGWLTPLLMSGLTIGISSTGQEIDASTLERDIGSFMTLMSQAFSAYDFSRTQSRRGTVSWEKRRADAHAGRATSRHRGRGWLRWDSAALSWIAVDEKVAVIRLMFKLRLEGHGKAAIAKRLNEIAIEDATYKPFSSSKIPPKLWTPSAVARIIQDRAVLGYVQYHRNPRGADQRIPEGDPVKVYPEIIDEETWARANDRRLQSRLKEQGRGRNVSNLLGKIIFCGRCGGSMQPMGSARIRLNRDGSTSQHYPIYCSAAKLSKGTACSNQRGWPYRTIETPLIEKLLALAIDDQHFAEDDDDVFRLEGSLAKLDRKIEDFRGRKRRLLDLLVRDDDDEFAEAFRLTDGNLCAAIEERKVLQVELDAARGKSSPADHLVRVAEVKERMWASDPEERYRARTLVKEALRSLIAKIVFMDESGAVMVHLVEGLGLLVIRPNGVVETFDLLHPKRQRATAVDSKNWDTVSAYIRRRGEIAQVAKQNIAGER